jgi:hypothetical protein
MTAQPPARDPKLLLASLKAEAPPPSSEDPAPEIAGTPRTGAIQKIRYSHDAMIDQIISNPAVSQGELAKMFGYTEGWVSQIMQSDAFRERLAERKKELIDPGIIASIEEKFRGVVSLSLDRLREKLEKEKSPSLETLELGLNIGSRALGYGARQTPTVQVAVQTVVHVPAKATSDEDWLRSKQVVGGA